MSTRSSLTGHPPSSSLFSRYACRGLPELPEGNLPVQELRQSIQLLLQPGQAFEARVWCGAQVSLSIVSVQDETQVESEHPLKRQAHEIAERLLQHTQRQQDAPVG